MEKFNKSIVELTFYFEDINESRMSIQIKDGEYVVPDKNIGTVSTDIDFPDKIILIVSGKNMNTDTILDKNNNIIADKHIKLIKVTVDKLPAPDCFLKSWPIVNGNKDNYFGFNGEVTLDFDDVDSFRWHLKSFKQIS